jgi:hypothetical protein
MIASAFKYLFEIIRNDMLFQDESYLYDDDNKLLECDASSNNCLPGLVIVALKPRSSCVI